MTTRATRPRRWGLLTFLALIWLCWPFAMARPSLSAAGEGVSQARLTSKSSQEVLASGVGMALMTLGVLVAIRYD